MAARRVSDYVQTDDSAPANRCSWSNRSIPKRMRTPSPPPRLTIRRLAETYLSSVLNQPRIFASRLFMNRTLLLADRAAGCPRPDLDGTRRSRPCFDRLDVPAAGDSVEPNHRIGATGQCLCSSEASFCGRSALTGDTSSPGDELPRSLALTTHLNASRRSRRDVHRPSLRHSVAPLGVGGDA